MLKKRKIKEILAAVLIAVFMVSTVGCNSATPTLTAVPTEDPKANDGPMVKYEQPVEMTVTNVTNATFAYIPGDSEDENIHTRMNKSYLNIIYKSKWVVAESKQDEKINIAIASNDLPDVLNPNTTQLQTLIKNGQVQDLTKVWAKYSLDEFRKNEEYQNKVALIPSSKDGKLYGLPLTGDFGESVGVMYIRKDWLTKVGLQAPKTIDDLITVCKAFINNDPDGNSKKDTFAIGLVTLEKNYGAGGTIEAIAAAYGAMNRMWIKDKSGKMVYGSVQPEMKTALAKMQELFTMGAFDPEFAVKDEGKIAESLTAGKTGIFFGVYSSPISTLMQNKAKDPAADWLALPIPTVKSGDTILVPAKPFAQRWVVVRKDYAYPEAMVKSMNLWYTTNYDATTPQYKEWLDANKTGGAYEGKMANVYSKPYYFQSVNGNLVASENLLYAKNTGDKSKLDVGGVVLDSMIAKGDALGWAFGKVFYESEVVVGNYGTNLKYTDYPGAATATMTSKGPSLDKLEAGAFTKIIMGDPISDFDAFVTKWHSLGGDEIAAEIEANLK